LGVGTDFIGVAIGFILGIAGSVVASLVAFTLEMRKALQSEKRHLEKQVREELYPSPYAVIESIRLTVLDPVKQLSNPTISEDQTKVLAELLKTHQKWLENPNLRSRCGDISETKT
jgi:glutamate/tyrosine decarboxylase-like PLP-dependent enzyme